MYTASPVYCLILGGETFHSGALAWSMDAIIGNSRYLTPPAKSKTGREPPKRAKALFTELPEPRALRPCCSCPVYPLPSAFVVPRTHLTYCDRASYAVHAAFPDGGSPEGSRRDSGAGPRLIM